MKRKEKVIEQQLLALEPVILDRALKRSRAGKLATKAAKTVSEVGVKKLALIGVGAVAALELAGNIYRTEKMKLVFRSELKKQLAPLNKKIDALEKQNEELKKELEKKK